jgi:hypothetical protein
MDRIVVACLRSAEGEKGTQILLKYFLVLEMEINSPPIDAKKLL